MAASNSILQKVEEAIKAYLAGQTLTLTPVANIFTGTSRGVNVDIDDHEEKSNPLPNVVIVCDNAEPQLFGGFNSGNWLVKPVLRIRSNADDTQPDAHRLRVAEVFRYFFINNLGEQITLADAISAARADFRAWVAWIEEPAQTVVVGRSWLTTLSISMICCGIDLDE